MTTDILAFLLLLFAWPLCFCSGRISKRHQLSFLQPLLLPASEKSGSNSPKRLGHYLTDGRTSSRSIGLQRYRLGQEHTELNLPVSCLSAAAQIGEPSTATERGKTVNFHVPFHILYLRATFFNPSQCILKHGNYRLLEQSANFSLGVGENSIILTVMDPNNRDFNTTVQINVRRLERPGAAHHNEVAFYEPCRLKQECNYLYDASSDCGLQRQSSAPSTWRLFLTNLNRLPHCRGSHTHYDGFWTVPCRSCQLEGSCLWSKAVWSYIHCQLHQAPLSVVKSRLYSSHVLFVGDSTLRGLMYSMFATLNGTLYGWKKSHDTVILHSHPTFTTLAFTYYPQFWLPEDATPSLEDTLLRLMRKADAFPSSGKEDRLVIVLGGAQWLNPKLLNQTHQLLQRLHMNKVPVITKDHSPGFHIRVPGVMYHSRNADDTLQFAKKNRELVETIKQLNFTLLPTFNLTSARFREFRPGRCSCHFHSVRRDISLPGAYQIHGDIHSAYSTILTNLLVDQLK